MLVIASHNYFYGTGLRRRVVHAMQFIHGLLILAGIVLFVVLANGFDLRPLLDVSSGQPWCWVCATYLLVCWTLAFAVLPAVTLRRQLRRTPAALLSNHTQSIDVVARLGYRPLGRGTLRRLACLPGNQVFQVDLVERTLCLKRLPPAWDGLTLLHLSDLHFCGTPDRAFFDQIMDLCTAWDLDLVAVTGDVVDSPIHHRWIVPILGRLRWRCSAFAVLGNHDCYYDPVVVRRRLRKLGMQVLGNSWTQTEVRGQPLVVIGHEGPWFGPPPDLSTCPSSMFRLCLSHTPDHITWARRHEVDLMLSGHVHGGQVRLPLIGPVVVPSLYGRRFDSGTFHLPPTVLHVSRGLSSEQPLRYNCRPEVTKLVLRRAANGA
jgi:predicted MPP superfamily phosphohydrolase